MKNKIENTTENEMKSGYRWGGCRDRRARLLAIQGLGFRVQGL